jgi:predicted DNA-binding protein YlxM (UPF0122 family)
MSPDKISKRVVADRISWISKMLGEIDSLWKIMSNLAVAKEIFDQLSHA